MRLPDALFRRKVPVGLGAVDADAPDAKYRHPNRLIKQIEMKLNKRFANKCAYVLNCRARWQAVNFCIP